MKAMLLAVNQFSIKSAVWFSSLEKEGVSIRFFKSKDFYIESSADRKTEEYLKKVLIVEQERLIKLSDVAARTAW